MYDVQCKECGMLLMYYGRLSKFCKYLGVVLDESLIWKMHKHNTIKFK